MREPPREDDQWEGEDTISLEEFKQRRAALTKMPGEKQGAGLVLGGREDWRDLLKWAPAKTKKALPYPKKCLENVLTTLLHCPAWQGVVRHNIFTDRMELAGALPTAENHENPDSSGAWRDGPALWCISWFNSTLGFEPSNDMMERALAEVARGKPYHPVREYLQALKWDGVLRTDSMLHQMFGAENSPANCAIGSKWLVSAVARVMSPGCQVDHMLVLEGPQGTRKSTALRTLVGDAWFRNSPLDLRDKDAMQALRGCWVYEFDELDSFRGRDATRVKSFITGRVDSYRPPYGRHPIDVPRQCAFAGSTNEERYLSDPTGNRRFWPVLCGAIDIPALLAARDQIWAEAFHRFQAGELWYVPEGELADELRRLQGERQELDPWVDQLRKWVDSLLEIRRQEGITTQQAMESGLDLKATSVGRKEETRVGHALKSMGWERRRELKNGVRTYRYYPPALPQTSFALPGVE